MAFLERAIALSLPSPVDEHDTLNRVVTRAYIDAALTSIMAEAPDALELAEVPRRRGVALGDLLDAGESVEAWDDGERNEWPTERVPRRRRTPVTREAERKRAVVEAEEAARAYAEAEALKAERERIRQVVADIDRQAAEAQREAAVESDRKARVVLADQVTRWARGEDGQVAPVRGLRQFALNTLHGCGLTLDVGAVEDGEVTLREVASGARFAVPVQVVNAYRAGQPFPRALLDRMLAARQDAFKAQSGLKWWEW